MILFRVSQWYVSHVTYRGIKKREGAFTKVSYFFRSEYKQGKEPIIWYIRYRTLSSRIKNCSMLVNFRLTKSLTWEFSSRFAMIEVSVNWHMYYIKRCGSYHLLFCYCQLIGDSNKPMINNLLEMINFPSTMRIELFETQSYFSSWWLIMCTKDSAILEWLAVNEDLYL